jgi:hypothetical protein
MIAPRWSMTQSTPQNYWKLSASNCESLI